MERQQRGERRGIYIMQTSSYTEDGELKLRRSVGSAMPVERGRATR